VLIHSAEQVCAYYVSVANCIVDFCLINMFLIVLVDVHPVVDYLFLILEYVFYAC
jgi:hypothetical protein